MKTRTPDSCPNRVADSSGPLIRCGLLREIRSDVSAIDDSVNADICSACCRAFLPTTDDINPVIASILWSRCESFLKRCDPADSKSERLFVTELLKFAEASLPIVMDDEDDLPEPVQNSDQRRPMTADEIAQVIPRPFAHRSADKHEPFRWQVGVTTAPRRLPTLTQCLESAIAAGWSSPHLFVDGQVVIAAEHQHLNRTTRIPAAGAWENFYLSLVEMVTREPKADLYMLLQDDALWPTLFPVRAYLDSIDWPMDMPLVFSAYCSGDYTTEQSRWTAFDRVWKLGAVALVFNRPAIQAFVNDELIQARSTNNQPGGIDLEFGLWAQRHAIPLYYPTPSLVQHIGDVSTLWLTSRAVGLRRASKFLGDTDTIPDELNANRDESESTS
jgi:hypothetical protein